MRHLGSIRSLGRYFVPIGLWGVRLRRRKVCSTSTCTGSQLAVHSVCGAFLISAPLESAAVLSAAPTRAIEKKVDRTGGAHCSLETQVRSREIIKHKKQFTGGTCPPNQNKIAHMRRGLVYKSIALCSNWSYAVANRILICMPAILR